MFSLLVESDIFLFSDMKMESIKEAKMSIETYLLHFWGKYYNKNSL